MSKAVTKIQPAPGALATAPDFMRQDAGQGMEELKHVVRPPRLKVVQKMARKPLSDLFQTGDVVAMPQMQLVMHADETFHAIPLLQYTEWCVWNPLDLRGTVPTIRERTLDPKHHIAILARDPNRRQSQPYPEMPEKDGKKLMLSYREHINFMLLLLPPAQLGIAELPVAVSYSKGEWQAGSNFASLLAQRNMRVTPIYGCRIEFSVGERNGPKGDWHGLNAANPSDGQPWNDDPDRYAFCKRLHEEFAEVLKQNRLEIEHEDEEESVDAKNNKDF